MPRGVPVEETITLIAPRPVTWEIKNNDETLNPPPTTPTSAKIKDGQNWVTTKAGVNQIELSTGPNPSDVDNDVKINITKGKKTTTYTITVVKVWRVSVQLLDTKTHKIPSNLQDGIEHFCTVKGQGESVLKCDIEPNTPGARNALVWKSANEGVPVISRAVDNDKRTAKYSRGAAAEIPITIEIGGVFARRLSGWVIWLTAVPWNQDKPKPEVVCGNYTTTMKGGYDFEFTISPPSIITAADRPDLSGNKTVTNPPGPPPADGLHMIDDAPLVDGATLKWDESRRKRERIFVDQNCDAFIITPTDYMQIVDGDAIAVSNGLVALVFEFDRSNDGVAAGNVKIDMRNVLTEDDIRDAIIAAVNSVQGFNIVASNAGPGKVRLRNENGVVGIKLYVSSPDFVVQGINSLPGAAETEDFGDGQHTSDGHILIIFNGASDTIFEYDNDDNVAEGHVAIRFEENDDVFAVRDKIKNAINGANIPDIKADTQPAPNKKVYLVNNSGAIHLRSNPDNYHVSWENRQTELNYFTGVNYPSAADADGRPGGAGAVFLGEEDVAGNDDAYVADEDNDPYDKVKYNPPELPAAQGKIYGSCDALVADLYYGVGLVGDKYQRIIHFKEFARIELDGKWYRCSDEILWRVHYNLKKVTEAGKQKWVNDPDEGMESTKALDNAGWRE